MPRAEDEAEQDMTFGQRLRTLRRQRGVGVKEMAFRMGWDVSAVGHAERDGREPYLRNFRRLRAALSLTADETLWLLGT